MSYQVLHHLLILVQAFLTISYTEAQTPAPTAAIGVEGNPGQDETPFYVYAAIGGGFFLVLLIFWCCHVLKRRRADQRKAAERWVAQQQQGTATSETFNGQVSPSRHKSMTSASRAFHAGDALGPSGPRRAPSVVPAGGGLPRGPRGAPQGAAPPRFPPAGAGGAPPCGPRGPLADHHPPRGAPMPRGPKPTAQKRMTILGASPAQMKAVQEASIAEEPEFEISRESAFEFERRSSLFGEFNPMAEGFTDSENPLYNVSPPAPAPAPAPAQPPTPPTPPKARQPSIYPGGTPKQFLVPPPQRQRPSIAMQTAAPTAQAGPPLPPEPPKRPLPPTKE